MKAGTEEHGGVQLADVAVALRCLVEPGLYPADYLYELYVATARASGNQPGSALNFAQVLGHFGCGTAIRGGQKVRMINVERLEKNWPRLPWRA